ncbi:hypothetical protein LXL04_033745 [Taraxacum kok-saghyz]
MVTPVTINVDEPLEVNLNLEKEKESLVIKDENSNGKSSPHHDDEDIIFPESLEHNLPDNLFASPTLKIVEKYRAHVKKVETHIPENEVHTQTRLFKEQVEKLKAKERYLLEENARLCQENLSLFQKVREDPVFRREGPNIHVDATLNITQVCPGTQPGQKVVLKGKDKQTGGVVCCLNVPLVLSSMGLSKEEGNFGIKKMKIWSFIGGSKEDGCKCGIFLAFPVWIASEQPSTRESLESSRQQSSQQHQRKPRKQPDQQGQNRPKKQHQRTAPRKHGSEQNSRQQSIKKQLGQPRNQPDQQGQKRSKKHSSRKWHQSKQQTEVGCWFYAYQYRLHWKLDVDLLLFATSSRKPS